MEFSTFIHMGGYALHVWGAYGLAVAGYGALLAHALCRYERLKKQDNKK